MKNIVCIVITGIIVTNCLSAQKFVYSATDDLDSDGTQENIKLENIPDGKYILTINTVNITGEFPDEEADGFQITDISKSDKYKEIAIHTPGPSDDDIYMIYWYNGKDIVFMNKLARWPVFKGNGIVYVDNWEGFWTSREKYVLDNTSHKLEKTEQFAYYVGVKVKAGKGLVIFKEKDLTNKIALLSEGSEIEILLCDKSGKKYTDHKYLIKSESGLLGWTDYNQLANKTKGLPWAD